MSTPSHSRLLSLQRTRTALTQSFLLLGGALPRNLSRSDASSEAIPPLCSYKTRRHAEDRQGPAACSCPRGLCLLWAVSHRHLHLQEVQRIALARDDHVPEGKNNVILGSPTGTIRDLFNESTCIDGKSVEKFGVFCQPLPGRNRLTLKRGLRRWIG